MAESLERKYAPPDNPEAEKQKESQKESEKYLKLAKENPHSLSEEIKKNPKTELLLRKLLGDNDYERIRDLNPMKLSEDTSIAKMQKEIYGFVDINPETDKNPTKEKFLKGLIDSIIVENAELAMKIIETKGKILVDMVDQILSWEGLSQIAEGLKTSVMGIFSGDAYKTGKSAGELGLITIASGAGGFLLKKAGKTAMKVGEGVAVRAGEKTALSQTLTLGGKGVEISGKIVQAPYNGVKAVGLAMKDGVKKVAEKTGISEAVKTASEPLRKVVSETSEKLSPHVKKIIDTTKQRAKETLALLATPILVGSKDGTEGMGKLRGQIGAIGNIPEDILGIEARRQVSEKLYKRYSYIDTPANREFLGELTPERILGEGYNGIIITHPSKEGVVVKIAHPRALHDLGVEAVNHDKAYQILREGRNETEASKKIPKTIIIPKIIEHFSETSGYYSMEKLPGQSLHTKFLRETFANSLKNDSKEFLDALTDNQLKRRLIDIHRVDAEFIDLAIENNSAQYTANFLATRPDYQQAKEYLKEKGFIHPDIHGGNIMLDNNGNLYIIDFGDKK